MALSPDGDRVAVGYQADGIWIYRISSGSQGAQCQALDVAVSALVWLSPQVLVSGAQDGALQGWMLKGSSLQSLWLWSSHWKAVLGLAASQELLAAASEDFTVRLWPRQLLTLPQKTEDFPCGIELRGHEGPVSCCSFSTDGCSLATGGRDRVSYRRMQPQAPLPQILSPLGPTPLWAWIPEQLTYHCFLWPLALPNLLRWICPPACL